MANLIQLLSSKTANKYVAPKLDSGSAALNTVDDVEHRINAGEHFTASVYDSDVDISGPKIFKLTTPNTTKWIHMNFQYMSSAAGLWEVYEAPTFGTTPAAGDAVTAINNNRNSATAAALVITQDATLGGGSPAKGTLIWQEYLGSGGRPLYEPGKKFVLKQNTVYLIYFTADADNTKANLMLHWSEYTNEE